jgi:hypothetical protein
MAQSSKSCYCAFCRQPRIVYRKRHVSVADIALSALTAVLLSFIFFQDFDPRAMMFFALSIGVAELFVVFRWRLSIACPHCGFDPVLYRRKPDLAAARVKDYYRQRLEDPLSSFSPPPKLPVLIRPKNLEPNRPTR